MYTFIITFSIIKQICIFIYYCIISFIISVISIPITFISIFSVFFDKYEFKYNINKDLNKYKIKKFKSMLLKKENINKYLNQIYELAKNDVNLELSKKLPECNYITLYQEKILTTEKTFFQQASLITFIHQLFKDSNIHICYFELIDHPDFYPIRSLSLARCFNDKEMEDKTGIPAQWIKNTFISPS